MSVEIVDLLDLIDADGVLADGEFAGVRIRGPVAVALAGEIVLTRCSFAGAFEDLLIEVEEGRTLRGVVLLRDCSFINCDFPSIAFVGPPSTIQTMRELMAIDAERDR